VAELKEVVRKKDEQMEALEVAAAKATSLEAEVAKLTQALADLEVSWKSKCERAAMAGQRLFREGEVYKRQLKSAYTKGQDELSRLGCQAGWINEAAMRKWYAEKNAAKVAWEQMTPEQKKQAEISQSLAKQHEAWRATSAGQIGISIAGDPRPPAMVAASPVRATGPEGSMSVQAVVSQVASSAVAARDPQAPGLAARAGVQKAPVRGRPGPEVAPGSSLILPAATVRSSFLSRDPLKQPTGQRVAGTVGQVRGCSGGAKGSVNKSSDSSVGRE